jgi:hypothetical protein
MTDFWDTNRRFGGASCCHHQNGIKKMSWEGYIEWMGKLKDHSEDLRVDERIILKWVTGNIVWGSLLDSYG